MTDRERTRRASGLPRAALLAVALGGCAAEDLRIVDTTVADVPAEVKYFGGTREEKRVFSPEDEEVVLSVRFGKNFIGAYQWFKVEWIRPDGKVYKRHGTRMNWGSHQNLNVTLPIRGTPAAKFFAGEWRVRVYLEGRPIVEETFRIRRERRISAWGVEDPLEDVNRKPPSQGCPALPAPPGRCVDRAPEE